MHNCSSGSLRPDRQSDRERRDLSILQSQYTVVQFAFHAWWLHCYFFFLSLARSRTVSSTTWLIAAAGSTLHERRHLICAQLRESTSKYTHMCVCASGTKDDTEAKIILLRSLGNKLLHALLEICVYKRTPGFWFYSLWLDRRSRKVKLVINYARIFMNIHKAKYFLEFFNVALDEKNSKAKVAAQKLSNLSTPQGRHMNINKFMKKIFAWVEFKTHLPTIKLKFELY